MYIKSILLAITLSFVFNFGFCQIKVPNKLNDVKKVAGGKNAGGSLSKEEIVNGLKEALSVGSKNSSERGSKEDGFYKNDKIFIPFPEEAEKAKIKAEKMGIANQVDKLVLSMNRSAEEAAKEAAPIFITAVKEMSVADGYTILTGEDNSATLYLQDKTTAQLKEKFAPIIAKAMDKMEVTKYWTPIITNYNKGVKLTGGEQINPDLNEYITDRAIIGLFVLLMEEEKKIRDNPTARVSDVLKKVFDKSNW